MNILFTPRLENSLQLSSSDEKTDALIFNEFCPESSPIFTNELPGRFLSSLTKSRKRLESLQKIPGLASGSDFLSLFSDKSAPEID